MSNVRNMLNDKGSKNREKSKSISWSKYLTSATKIGFNAFLDIGRWVSKEFNY